MEDGPNIEAPVVWSVKIDTLKGNQRKDEVHSNLTSERLNFFMRLK